MSKKNLYTLYDQMLQVCFLAVFFLFSMAKKERICQAYYCLLNTNFWDGILMTKELIKKIDDENFSQTISNEVVLIDFFAEWCGPCRMLAPILDALAEELTGKVTFGQIDVDQSPKTTTTYQITSVPTLILFKKGKEVNRVVGLKDQETLKKIIMQAM